MPQVGERRTGRRPGTPETQPAILAAARQLFAAKGYTGTSIRSIAATAGVDPALVHHYFGTKEGLFRAALQVPIDPDEIVSQIADVGREAAPLQFATTFLGVWDSPDTGPAMVSFLRRMLAEQTTTEMIRDFFGTAVMRAAAGTLLADVAPGEARARVGLVITQMLGVVIARRVVAIEPLASWPADELAAAIAPTIERYLYGDIDFPLHATTEGDGHESES